MLTPAEWHERNHVPLFGPMPPIEECRRCQLAVIRCGGKVTYDDPSESFSAGKALNVERGAASLVRSYRCRYCLKWHLTSRMSKTQERRAEKHRRKQLTRPDA